MVTTEIETTDATEGREPKGRGEGAGRKTGGIFSGVFGISSVDREATQRTEPRFPAGLPPPTATLTQPPHLLAAAALLHSRVLFLHRYASSIRA